MALPAKQQATYWGAAAAVTFIALWTLGDVLMPFILGGAIAYLLDPVADRLEAWGLSRALAVTLISLTALLLFVMALLIVIPALIGQFADLRANWSSIIDGLTGRVRDMIVGTPLERFLVDQQTFQSYMADLTTWLQNRAGSLAEKVLGSFRGVVNIVMLLLIVPVVTIYLLVDWDRMIAGIDDLLPRDHAPIVRKIAGDIDKTLSGFVRGQGLVCVIIGTFYSVALSIVGLNFALVVGFIAGLVSFIPFVGAIIGGVLAIGLALVQFWGDWWMILAVAAIFQAGQFLEGNILTPKLVGNSVGLHPVMLLVALSVFGALFGFAGLLVAVPLAAMLGVLFRFGVSQYKESRLYKGHAGQEEGAE
ncbi:MAG: AI-2E family transporter [Rhodobacterales bacterium]|nr:MAG: AI-2E family transporter [Rhodobacterales bacterium]